MFTDTPKDILGEKGVIKMESMIRHIQSLIELQNEGHNATDREVIDYSL